MALDPALVSRYNLAVQKVEESSEKFNTFIEGGEDVLIPTESGQLPTLSNIAKQLLGQSLELNQFVETMSDEMDAVSNSTDTQDGGSV